MHLSLFTRSWFATCLVLALISTTLALPTRTATEPATSSTQDVKAPAQTSGPDVNKLARMLVAISGDDEAARKAAAKSLLGVANTVSKNDEAAAANILLDMKHGSPQQNLPSKNSIYWPPFAPQRDINDQVAERLAGYAIKKLQTSRHLNLEDDLTRLSDSKVLGHLEMGVKKQSKNYGFAVWFEERLAFGLILPKVPGWEKGHLVTMSEDQKNIFMDPGALVEKDWFQKDWLKE